MDIQWLFFKYSNLWTKIYIGYLGAPCSQPKATEKDGKHYPICSLSFCTRAPDWSFLCDEQESYWNLIGLKKLLLLPPATAHGEVPPACQAADSKVDLLPPFTRKETLALRDKATTSGSAAAMPVQACLMPQPPFTVPVAGHPTFSCSGPTRPSGEVYGPPFRRMF